MQAYRNLNWLLNWSTRSIQRDDDQEQFCQNPYPIYTFGVVASSLRNDVWYSCTTTLSAKNDRAQIPQLAAEKFGTEAALTLQEFFETAVSSHCPTIRPLETANLVKLLDELVKLHGTAYNWNAQMDVSKLIKTIGSQPIRTHIRAILEVLDIAYLYNETVELGVTELVETSVQEEEGFFAIEDAADV